MIKNYILDTNVMIHDPNCFYKFEDNRVIIPILCIEELDHLKTREGMVGYHARCAARELMHIREIVRRGQIAWRGLSLYRTQPHGFFCTP